MAKNYGPVTLYLFVVNHQISLRSSAKKLLKICDLVEEDTCDRRNVDIEDFKHLLNSLACLIHIIDNQKMYSKNLFMKQKKYP